jgi:hypothetical protein
LDPAHDPTFGSAALKAGFTPDPFKRDVSAGGRVATQLGGVSTHVSTAPEFRLDYTAGAAPLVFEVESKGETTLLVHMPDGKWIANGDGLRGQIVIEKPATGRYDLYVGAVGDGTVPATLVISGQPRPALAGKGNVPDCYLLSAGVDFFITQNKLRGCQNDARDLSAAFRKQAGTVYRKVDYAALLGDSAKQANILRGFQKFADVGFPGDTFVLSLSGHGGIDGSYWFFTPFDFHAGDQLNTALVDEQLLSACAKLMTQRKTAILVLDACHSGKMIANAKVYFERHKDALEAGGLVVMAACADKQEATNAGENGVLSKSLAEALSPLGDLDGDGRITLDEVQKYVIRRTAELVTPLKHNQDAQVALFGTCTKELTVAVAKPLAPVARKFEPPKLPRTFGEPKWDVAALESRFNIVSCRIDPSEPTNLVFALDLREDLPRPLKYNLVLVDADGVKTKLPGNATPGSGSAGGRMVLTFSDALIRRTAWRSAVSVQFTLE